MVRHIRLIHLIARYNSPFDYLRLATEVMVGSEHINGVAAITGAATTITVPYDAPKLGITIAQFTLDGKRFQY